LLVIHGRPELRATTARSPTWPGALPACTLDYGTTKAMRLWNGPVGMQLVTSARLALDSCAYYGMRFSCQSGLREVFRHVAAPARFPLLRLPGARRAPRHPGGVSQGACTGGPFCASVVRPFLHGRLAVCIGWTGRCASSTSASAARSASAMPPLLARVLPFVFCVCGRAATHKPARAAAIYMHTTHRCRGRHRRARTLGESCPPGAAGP
jgi:hypothetical protein